MNLEQAKQKLETYHQTHLLQYYSVLSDEEKAALLEQIEQTDFSVVDKIKKQSAASSERVITPIEAMPLEEIEKNKQTYIDTGIEEIRAGKVAAVLLAGGMGTRLGSDNPKGMYDIGLTKPVYIFQRLIENLLETVDLAKAWIPLFIMTSDKNHEATTSFFEEHNYFGYDKKQIYFFKQDMAPASDYEGHIFLEAKGKIATSPNGNGGWFTSMQNKSILAHTCTASPLTSVVCSKNFCPFIYLVWVTLNSF